MMGQKRIIKKAKAIHGNNYEYKLRKGGSPNLLDLKIGERVCAGGRIKSTYYHVLLTPLTK